MKTAILFTGTAYNFTDSIESLKINFADASDADVFILTSKYNRRRRTRSGEIPSAHDPDKWHEKSLGIEIEESQLSGDEIQHIKNVFGDRLKGLWFIEDLPSYSDKVKKYIIFHDVVSFWEKGQGYESGGGLKYAIEPFMASHPEWKQVYRAENNNGLLIIERC